MTAEDLLILLKPQFSVVGSNRRNSEELIISSLREFFFKVEGKSHISFSPLPQWIRVLM